MTRREWHPSELAELLQPYILKWLKAMNIMPVSGTGVAPDPQPGWKIELAGGVLDHSSWNGDSVSTGTYTIDPSSWGVPEDAQAVYIHLTCQWSDGASDSIRAHAHHPNYNTGGVQVRNTVSGLYNEKYGWVTCAPDGTFALSVYGATVDEVWLEVQGWAR